MSDNNNSAPKVIFWSIFIIILSIVVMCYWPMVKERVGTAVSSVSIEGHDQKLENNDDVFSEYEVKGNDIVINSYLDGVVFNSSDNYKVKILKDDMGYILTSEGKDGSPPKEYYFIGKGWFNMTTSPTVLPPTIEKDPTISIDSDVMSE